MRRATWRACALVIALTTAIGGIATRPEDAEAYTWSSWSTRYYTATTTECNASRQLAERFTGPIAYYSSSCVYRVRSRYAVIDDWAGWTDRIIQIDNSAPYWAEAWGMRLTVRVHWNGSQVRYAPETLLCTKWAFLIKVTQTDCTVFGNGTANLTARMAYEASFSYLFMNAAVDRGAQQSVSATGKLGLVTMWP